MAQLWGGRFTKADRSSLYIISMRLSHLTRSFINRIFEGSIAHVTMLGKTGHFNGAGDEATSSQGLQEHQGGCGERKA